MTNGQSNSCFDYKFLKKYLGYIGVAFSTGHIAFFAYILMRIGAIKLVPILVFCKYFSWFEIDVIEFGIEIRFRLNSKWVLNIEIFFPVSDVAAAILWVYGIDIVRNHYFFCISCS